MTDDGQAAVAVEVNHNAVRYIGGASYDASTGEIDGGAFERKPKDTDGLSFTVRGILHANTLEDVAAIRKITASRMKLGKTGCFAELNVGAMLETLAEFGDFFSFVYDPLPQEGSKLDTSNKRLISAYRRRDVTERVVCRCFGEVIR